MSQALIYFYQYFHSFVGLVFNDLKFSDSNKILSLGFILVSILVFGILISSVLSVPRLIKFKKPDIEYERETNALTERYDSKGRLIGFNRNKTISRSRKAK